MNVVKEMFGAENVTFIAEKLITTGCAIVAKLLFILLEFIRVADVNHGISNRLRSVRGRGCRNETSWCTNKTMIYVYFILWLHTRFKYTSFGAVCDVGCPRRHSRRHPRRHAGRRQPTTIPTPFDTVLDPLGGSRDQVGLVFRGRFSGSCTKYW